jgi:hypothetical protein
VAVASETTVAAFFAHKYRDTDSHSKAYGFYLDPKFISPFLKVRWSPSRLGVESPVYHDRQRGFSGLGIDCGGTEDRTIEGRLLLLTLGLYLE